MITHKIFKNCLEKNFSTLIQSIHKDLSWHANIVGLSGDGETAFLLDTHWLSGLIFHYGAIVNSEAWNFSILGSSSVQFSKFNAGEGHNWHSDLLGITPRKELSRKITVILDIDNHEHQSESQIELLITAQGEKETILRLDQTGGNNVYVFPSYIPWRITPLKQKTRSIIIGWILGDAFV